MFALKVYPVSVAEFQEKLDSLITEKNAAFSQLEEFIKLAQSGNEGLIDFGHEIRARLSRIHIIISEIAVFSRIVR